MGLFISFLLVVFYLLFLFPNEMEILALKPSGFHLEIIHRDSSKSPLYPGNITFTERIQRNIKFSENRASYLLSKQTMNPNLMKPYVIPDGFSYLVRIGVGTPFKSLYLILDSGSDLTWIQCEPCKQCFKQRYPIFDPRNSSTYKKIICANPLCSLFQCVRGECPYLTKYLSGQFTTGVASTETFTVSTKDEPDTHLLGVLFGCSYKSVGFETQKSIIAGIMGLNRSPISFVSQLSSFIEKRFSYCFTNPHLKDFPINYLRFGSDIGFIGGAVKKTPLVYHPEHMYGLNLLDISVQNTRLNYPPDTFKLNRTTGQGGFIIDTGAAITILDSNVYMKLKEAVDEYVSRYHSIKHINCPVPNIHLCFMLDNYNSFPTLTFHFENADLKLEVDNVFFIDKERNFFGLAITSMRGVNILGAYQQFNTRFIFSFASETMAFVRTNCSDDIG